MAGLDDLYAADTLKAATLAGALPPDVATVKRSTWVDSVPNAMDAAVRGIVGGAAKVGAAALEFAGKMEAGQERSIRQRGEREPYDMSRQFGLMAESVRDVERSLRPDPITAGAAENVVYGLSSVLSQAIPASIVGGPLAGAAVVGAGEGAAATDDLQRAKVDDATAAKAGLLAGGAAALGVVLPVAGSTLARTGMLYLAGGPGAFMAQQAATREILERANYADLAKQYDPLDPTGLALSSLFPLPFAAHGALRNIAASEKPAPKGENKPVAGDRAPGVPKVAEPSARTSTSDDVDAALVHNLTLQQDAHEAVPPAARAAELMRGPVTENPNFKAWFGDSKVVGEDGTPLVVYHGTTRSFDTFDPNAPRTALPLPGIFFSPYPEIASTYAAIGREIRDADGFIVGAEGGNTVPVYLSIKNPILLRYDDRKTGRMTGYKTVEADLLAARKAGHDGAIIEGWTDGSGPMQYVAFRPEQIKSAIGNSGRFDPNSASLTDPWQARIDATPTEAATALETREVPVKSITLSDDVPQFKSGANAAGVVEPLGGSFDRTGVAPIQLWERTDGRLEVISGRHRLDLAQRSGEETIPAQIHREADGFDVRRAAALDAELNIRDGQGKVRDYVDYFQATGLDRATAEQRGLLARSTGKRAYAIANDGSPELIAAHRAGAVSDEAAVAIAGAAPGDSRLQAVGIRAVQDGKTIAQAANTVRAVKLLAGERADNAAGDLFGFDDSAMREAESMAKIATAKQREVQTRLSAISGAAKRPELAKAEGVNIKDAAAVLRRVEALRAESAAWENWTTNPALVEAIRAELHPDGAPLLQAHSADDLAAKAAREADAPKLDEKAQIDAEREHFQLVQQAVEGRVDTTGDMFGAHMRSVADRVASVEKENPAAAQEMAAARELAAEGDDVNLGALDADLLQVAANCALSLGGA